MKKIFFAVLFFSSCFTVINAQVTFKPGVKAGLNFSNFTNSETDAKTDFYVGGLLAIKFAKSYTLQPELVYSRQGAYEKITNAYVVPNASSYIQGYDRTVKYSLDYISLGIINKFTLGQGFNFVVGPSLDFKVFSDFKSGYDNPIGFDFAVIGGVGYTFSNGISIDARFKQGVLDIFGDNYDEDILNQLVQVGVSYTFDFKEKNKK